MTLLRRSSHRMGTTNSAPGEAAVGEDSLHLLPLPLYAVKAAAVRARTLGSVLHDPPEHSVPPGEDAGPGFRVLFYHRVADDQDALAVSPRHFAQQMAYLADNGFTVVDLRSAVELAGDHRLPPRTVVLNFDDGYRDVAEHALPVLERYDFPATVFVVNDAVTGTVRFPWYRCQPPLLSWHDIDALQRSSRLDFQAHTLTHRKLTALPSRSAAREISQSKRDLEDRTGRSVDAFCYPAGVFGPRERQFTVDSGYRIALTCEPGVNRTDTDRFTLRRTAVERYDSLADFRARLAGVHDRPLPGRTLLRRLRYGVGPDRCAERAAAAEPSRGSDA